MLRASTCLCFILGAWQAAASAQCSVDADGKSTCSEPDQNALLQGRVHVSLGKEPTSSEVYKYGPYKTTTSLLTYYKHWAKGSIESRIRNMVNLDQDGPSKPSLLETDRAALSAAAAMDALAVTMINQCDIADGSPVTGPQGHVHTPAMAAIRRAGYEVVHAEPADSDGVRHTLLQDRFGKLQYMASFTPDNGVHHAIRTDPHICSDNGPVSFVEADDASDGTPDGPVIRAGDPILPNNSRGVVNANDPTPTPHSGAGAPNMLTNDDPLVKDCKKLFERTYTENCGGQVEVRVVSATREIVDGLAVSAEVHVCKSDGTSDDAGDSLLQSQKMCHEHFPLCVWEKSTDHTDAKLLQQSTDPSDQTNPTALETAGLTATLKLRTDLCHSADAGSVAQPAAVSLGELSRYVGYEHVWDKIPTVSALEVETPAEVDFRTKYPSCYPTLPSNSVSGTEVVRNQGTCGSCWAFASATSTMGNLCHSDTANKHSLFSSADRFEISTQKIMSCKATGDSDAMGCQGGHMQQFNDEAKTWGLTKERDNEYKCGGGDPKNHFSQQAASCDQFPWGGTCSGDPVQSWWWGGASKINGEDGMKTFIANGQGMYVSMDCYGNFMNYAGGVYTAVGDGKKGGHAMTGMGYGVDGGEKYWLIQNSWGPGWGEGGRCKFGRGYNLAGIEENAAVPRVWVQGGTEPPCQDSSAGSGLTSGGGQTLPCSGAAAYCNHGSFGGTVSANCPKTCGTCTGFNGKGTSPAPPGPPPGPNPQPAPSPSQPPSPGPPSSGGCCSDTCSASSDCWKGGWGANDKLFCCPGHSMCMDRTTYGNYGDNCKACKAANPAPSPPPPAPGATGGCCRDACSSSADCGNQLFCCPGHSMCMDRSTSSTAGPNCNACKGIPPPPPPPPPAPAPPAPAGSEVCSFETPQKPYCGIWNDETNDNFDWTRQQKKTPSSGTGPEAAADGTYYLFTETSNPIKSGNTAILKSVNTDITGSDAKLQFQYHMYSSAGKASLGDLEVKVTTFAGATTQVWKEKDSSKQWKTANVDLGSYAGKKVSISFNFKKGRSWRSDVAIDNVILFAGAGAPPPPPAPPAPTTAPTGPPINPATTAAPSPGGADVPKGNCVNSLVFEDDNGDGCADWAGKTCKDLEVERHCPRACGICSGDVTDDPTYTDPVYKVHCNDWAGHSCLGYEYTTELVLNCPKACGAAA